MKALSKIKIPNTNSHGLPGAGLWIIFYEGLKQLLTIECSPYWYVAFVQVFAGGWAGPCSKL